VDTASARIAACSNGTLSGILVRPKPCATVYSAHAPSYANAISRMRRQFETSPRRQFTHSMHGLPAATTTRSPTAHPVTPCPSFATVPDASWPCVTTGNWLGNVPLIRLRSEWQMPQNATFTNTSPGPGSGMGTSSTAMVLESA